MRKLVVAVTVCAGLACAAVDLAACGDKYARVGQSSRLKGYAPLHPASILVYSPADAKRDDVKEFDALLTRAGHKPVFVPHGGDLEKALAAGKYDLLIVHYPDAAAIKGRVQTGPNAPVIVPILPDKLKKLEPQVHKDYAYVITPYKMSKWDALEQLDVAMTARLKATPTSSASK
jgi:hypothetical protein